MTCPVGFLNFLRDWADCSISDYPTIDSRDRHNAASGAACKQFIRIAGKLGAQIVLNNAISVFCRQLYCRLAGNSLKHAAGGGFYD